MAINLFVPAFRVDECLDEIRECLEKGWTGLGFKTVEFENRWKEYTGLGSAHFLNSATAGLNMAFDILKDEYNWDDADEVITTPLTFISTNHSIVLADLTPVFTDVDNSLCLDPIEVENNITDKTRAVLFVGIGGNTGQYKRIVDICKKYDLKLILDAAHMAGTRQDGEIPGKEADAVIYSFQAVKNLPTADSGMICFKESRLDQIARKKAWLGINKDTYTRTNSTGLYKWKYDVEYVGQKYHGNSVMAAIGLVQLKYLDKDNEYRRQLADRYRSAFKPFEDKIKLVDIPDDCETSAHLFQIIVDNRDELITYLNEKEIYPGVHYIDNTNYAMYSESKNKCPRASYISKHILSLPIHMKLTFEDVDSVIASVLDFSLKHEGLNVIYPLEKN
jgi:dTDP-4-amino-4,6-dideoxygalactose transaminase